MKNIIFMVGPSCSGKTTKAEEIKNKDIHNTVICSNDDRFYDESGNYKFDWDLMPAAQKACFKKAVSYMKAEVDTIIIDNTNLNIHNIQNYCIYGRFYGYHLSYVDCGKDISFDVIFKRNQSRSRSKVPEDGLKKLFNNYENNKASVFRFIDHQENYFDREAKTEIFFNIMDQFLGMAHFIDNHIPSNAKGKLVTGNRYSIDKNESSILVDVDFARTNNGRRIEYIQSPAYVSYEYQADFISDHFSLPKNMIKKRFKYDTFDFRIGIIGDDNLPKFLVTNKKLL